MFTKHPPCVRYAPSRTIVVNKLHGVGGMELLYGSWKKGIPSLANGLNRVRRIFEKRVMYQGSNCMNDILRVLV